MQACLRLRSWFEESAARSLVSSLNLDRKSHHPLPPLFPQLQSDFNSFLVNKLEKGPGLVHNVLHWKPSQVINVTTHSAARSGQRQREMMKGMGGVRGLMKEVRDAVELLLAKLK